MTNPTVEEEYKNVTYGPVRIGRHVIIGSGAIVLPCVSLEEGACVGALSLVNHDCEAFTVYVGVPARSVKARSRRLLELEKMRGEALSRK
jgi:galactoside O-acetyltransferase